MMTNKPLSRGKILAASLLEKVMLIPDFSCSLLGNPWVYDFYGKHMSSVFPLGEVGTFSTGETSCYDVDSGMWNFISHPLTKIDVMLMKEVCPYLVLLGPHGGRHCTRQKVKVYIVSLHG